MTDSIYDLYRKRVLESAEHSDHVEIEVRDGAGIVRGGFLRRDPFYEVSAFYATCEWCGFVPYDKVVAEHPTLGVAYFPYDDAIHCITPEHCRRRLLVRIRLLLVALKLEKMNLGYAMLADLLPEELA